MSQYCGPRTRADVSVFADGAIVKARGSIRSDAAIVATGSAACEAAVDESVRRKEDPNAGAVAFAGGGGWGTGGGCT